MIKVLICTYGVFNIIKCLYFLISPILGQKFFKKFRLLFGRFEDTKISFRNYLTFRGKSDCDKSSSIINSSRFIKTATGWKLAPLHGNPTGSWKKGQASWFSSYEDKKDFICLWKMTWYLNGAYRVLIIVFRLIAAAGSLSCQKYVSLPAGRQQSGNHKQL